jgi:hypothetical protein
MEERGLIIRKKNQMTVGVLIYLTELVKKRDLSKNTVLKFNDTVKVITEELKHFIEVSETINELIQNKNIFNQPEKIDNETHIKKVAVIWNYGFGNCLPFCQYWCRSFTRYRSRNLLKQKQRRIDIRQYSCSQSIGE